MQSSNQSKVVLITGASSGIGKALTIKYLQQGYKVAICARDFAKLQQFEQEIANPNLLTCQTDVSKEEDCRRFIEVSVQHFGQIDILINNAGISMRALFEEVDLTVLRQSMDINFWGTVYCTKYALPYIIQSKGTIAGISSIAGYKGLPCRTGYSASKFAMQGFLESLKLEMIPKQVHVDFSGFCCLQHSKYCIKCNRKCTI
jgi:NADP-dependent 3-hydroxy acid dehydrogenase YdfG